MTELLRYLNSISPLQDATWDRIETLFVENALTKGEYFIEEGQVGKKIGYIQKGIVRAFYRNNEGIEYNKHFFTENTIIGGYSSLITKTPNNINQQALSDCNLLVANFADITSLYDEHQDLERMARRLAELYFVEKEKRELDIVLLDADKRYLIFQREYPSLEQLIPQYHIASYLGVTPTQTSRIEENLAKGSFSLHM